MSDPDHRLELLRQRYATSLPSKRVALAEAWRTFASAPDDAATFRELSMQVHRLSGSAGAYGYDRLGERACLADRLIGDQLIAPERHRGAALVRYFAASVQSLLDELEAAHAHEAPPMQDARAAR